MSYVVKTAAVFLAGFSALAEASVYAGLGLGADIARFSQTARIVQPGTFDAIDKTQLSGLGLFGTLFAGTEMQKQHYHAALELNGDLSSLNFKASNLERLNAALSETKYRLGNSFGISLLPGYEIRPQQLAYLRLGLENAGFRSSTTDISLANISKRVNGFRYGLGLRQQMSQRYGFRIDYSLVNYQNIRFNTLDILSNTSKHTALSPFQQMFELGFVYTPAF